MRRGLGLVLVVILCGAVVVSAVSDLHGVFGKNKERCGKQTKDNKKCSTQGSPCCSKMGFCGSRNYHCLKRYGCQSGCKNEQDMISAGKPKPVVPGANQHKTVIVKTITTAVPVCMNCNADGAPKPETAAQTTDGKVATGQKIAEETTESVTETRPKEEAKNVIDFAPHFNNIEKKLKDANKEAAKIIANAEKQSNQGVTAGRNVVVVKVTGGNGAPASTLHIANRIPDHVKNVMDPNGY